MFSDGFNNFGGFGSFGMMFGITQIISILMFVLVFGVILFTLIKGVAQWNKNNHSPRLSVDARVIGKREEFSRRRHHNDSMHHHTSTYYYVTFEVESGDRIEFAVMGSEYGMLIEGDAGKLTFQGTRYLGFERMR